MNILQRENQELKAFMQSMGAQMNKLTMKLEECQAVNLRSRQVELVEQLKRGRKVAKNNNHDSQIPNS
jgi:hypothetical protein